MRRKTRVTKNEKNVCDSSFLYEIVIKCLYTSTYIILANFSVMYAHRKS